MEWFKAAEKFNQALASADPTPGGGAAAAMAVAMGCSLAIMAGQTTLNKKSTTEDVKTRLIPPLRKLGALTAQLNHFIEEDGAAYTGYLVAKKLPKEDPNREKALQDALIYAAQIPADTATTAITCLHEIEALQDFIAPVILSDVHCARHLLKGAIACCIENIKANLAFITQPEQIQKFQKQIEGFQKFC